MGLLVAILKYTNQLIDKFVHLKRTYWTNDEVIAIIECAAVASVGIGTPAQRVEIHNAAVVQVQGLFRDLEMSPKEPGALSYDVDKKLLVCTGGKDA